MKRKKNRWLSDDAVDEELDMPKKNEKAKQRETMRKARSKTTAPTVQQDQTKSTPKASEPAQSRLEKVTTTTEFVQAVVDNRDPKSPLSVVDAIFHAGVNLAVASAAPAIPVTAAALKVVSTVADAAADGLQQQREQKGEEEPGLGERLLRLPGKLNDQGGKVYDAVHDGLYWMASEGAVRAEGLQDQQYNMAVLFGQKASAETSVPSPPLSAPQQSEAKPTATTPTRGQKRKEGPQAEAGKNPAKVRRSRHSDSSHPPQSKSTPVPSVAAASTRSSTKRRRPEPTIQETPPAQVPRTHKDPPSSSFGGGPDGPDEPSPGTGISDAIYSAVNTVQRHIPEAAMVGAIENTIQALSPNANISGAAKPIARLAVAATRGQGIETLVEIGVEEGVHLLKTNLSRQFPQYQELSLEKQEEALEKWAKDNKQSLLHVTSEDRRHLLEKLKKAREASFELEHRVVESRAHATCQRQGLPLGALVTDAVLNPLGIAHIVDEPELQGRIKRAEGEKASALQASLHRVQESQVSRKAEVATMAERAQAVREQPTTGQAPALGTNPVPPIKPSAPKITLTPTPEAEKKNEGFVNALRNYQAAVTASKADVAAGRDPQANLKRSADAAAACEACLADAETPSGSKRYGKNWWGGEKELPGRDHRFAWEDTGNGKAIYLPGLEADPATGLSSTMTAADLHQFLSAQVRQAQYCDKKFQFDQAVASQDLSRNPTLAADFSRLVDNPSEWRSVQLLRAELSKNAQDKAAFYQDALKVASDCVQARVGLGNVLFAEKQYAEAREHLEWLLHNKPDLTAEEKNKLYLSIGQTYAYEGKAREALNYYERCRERTHQLSGFKKVAEREVGASGEPTLFSFISGFLPAPVETAVMSSGLPGQALPPVHTSAQVSTLLAFDKSPFGQLLQPETDRAVENIYAASRRAVAQYVSEGGTACDRVFIEAAISNAKLFPEATQGVVERALERATKEMVAQSSKELEAFARLIQATDDNGTMANQLNTLRGHFRKMADRLSAQDALTTDGQYFKNIYEAWLALDVDIEAGRLSPAELQQGTQLLLDGVHREIKKQQQAEAEQEAAFADQVELWNTGLQFCARWAHLLPCDERIKKDIVSACLGGQKLVKIAEHAATIRKFNKVNWVKAATAWIGIIDIALTFLADPQQDPLQQVSQQLSSLRDEMHGRFDDLESLLGELRMQIFNGFCDLHAQGRQFKAEVKMLQSQVAELQATVEGVSEQIDRNEREKWLFACRTKHAKLRRSKQPDGFLGDIFFQFHSDGCDAALALSCLSGGIEKRDAKYFLHLSGQRESAAWHINVLWTYYKDHGRFTADMKACDRQVNWVLWRNAAVAMMDFANSPTLKGQSLQEDNLYQVNDFIALGQGYCNFVEALRADQAFFDHLYSGYQAAANKLLATVERCIIEHCSEEGRWHDPSLKAVVEHWPEPAAALQEISVIEQTEEAIKNSNTEYEEIRTEIDRICPANYKSWLEDFSYDSNFMNLNTTIAREVKWLETLTALVKKANTTEWVKRVKPELERLTEQTRKLSQMKQSYQSIQDNWSRDVVLFGEAILYSDDRKYDRTCDKWVCKTKQLSKTIETNTKSLTDTFLKQKDEALTCQQAILAKALDQIPAVILKQDLSQRDDPFKSRLLARMRGSVGVQTAVANVEEHLHLLGVYLEFAYPEHASLLHVEFPKLLSHQSLAKAMNDWPQTPGGKHPFVYDWLLARQAQIASKAKDSFYQAMSDAIANSPGIGKGDDALGITDTLNRLEAFKEIVRSRLPAEADIDMTKGLSYKAFPRFDRQKEPQAQPAASPAGVATPLYWQHVTGAPAGAASAATIPSRDDLTVDTAYWYRDEDMTAILNARVREYTQQQYAQQPGAATVYAMAAVDTRTEGSLQQRLVEERDAHPGKRVVLIPCNFNNRDPHHWVGLLFEFAADNTCLRAEFLDSLRGDHSLSERLRLQAQINAVYPGQPLEEKPLHTIQQDDGSTCGACTIENLILRIDNPAAEIGEAPAMLALRQRHLQCLQSACNEEGLGDRERTARQRCLDRFAGNQANTRTRVDLCP